MKCMRYLMKWTVEIAVFLAVCSCIACGTPAADNGKAPYVVLIGEEKENLDRFPKANILVLDGQLFSAEEIRHIKDNGTDKVYSYLNVGALENFRDYYEEFYSYTLSDYENWPEERWIDVSNIGWQQFILEKAEELADKGVDGFFIDNTDIYYLYPEKEIFDGMVNILSGIHRMGKTVIINGGDSFVAEYLGTCPAHGTEESETHGNYSTEYLGNGGALESELIFDGVNQESVYTSYDFEHGKCAIQSEDEKEYLLDYLKTVDEAGVDVFLLEYATEKQTVEEARTFAKKNGWTCYVSDNIELRINGKSR